MTCRFPHFWAPENHGGAIEGVVCKCATADPKSGQWRGPPPTSLICRPMGTCKVLAEQDPARPMYKLGKLERDLGATEYKVDGEVKLLSRELRHILLS